MKVRGLDAIKRINAWRISNGRRPIPREHGYVLFANEVLREEKLGREGNYSSKSQAKAFLQDFAGALVRRGVRLARASRVPMAARAKPPRIRVTKTIHYAFDAGDNLRLDAFYESREWKMMRYEALRKHGALCQCCGAGPTPGKPLNVDHIRPLRVFWELRLDLNNLQVLCSDCNEGKGARHADDWRKGSDK